MNRKHLGLVLSVLFLGATAFAADPVPMPATQPVLTIAPAAPPSTQPAIAAKTDLLGPEFSSEIYGLALRPPLDCTEVHKAAPDTVVEFDQDKKNWLILVRQVQPDHSLPLTIHNDQFGQPQEGMLEEAIRQIVRLTPGAEIIEDAGGVRIFNVGRVRVGGIFARFVDAKQQRKLLLEAIVEVPDADHRLYYFIDFIANARPADAAPDDVDPGEKDAYDTFSEMIDSIKLTDRTKVFEDQRDRLVHTRALFVNWASNHGEPLKKILQPDQWQRIVKDGKDIGYSHTNEYVTDFVRSPDGAKEATIKNPDEYMIHVDTRSRLFPVAGTRWDTGTWMRVSINRKDESWASVARGTDTKGDLLADLFQIGSSHEHTKTILMAPSRAATGMLGDAVQMNKNPGEGEGNANLVDARTLNVKTTLDKSDMDPFNQDVPVFYVPQAISSLLPRLLPLNQPKKYMFATFVATPWSDVGKGKGGGRVMSRYLDVLPIQLVNFNGQSIEAVPVTDHIGLAGPVTTNYLSSDGKFLGSTCSYSDGKDKDGAEKQTTLLIIPSTIEDMEKLWSHPDIDVPREAPIEGPIAPPGPGFSQQPPPAVQ